MSGVASAQQAARLTDPVGHGLGMIGMIAGAVAGAVVGALLIAGGIVTGGALIAVVVAGCVAGGGLAGGQLLRGIQRAAGLSNPTTGVLGPGSMNVRIGSLQAARVFDKAVACNGLYSVNHFPLPMVPIAEGSATVRINGRLAARVTSKLVCGAPIIRGKETVQIGGPTQQVLPIHDNEEFLQQGLQILGLLALGGGALLAAAAGGAALLGFAAWTAGGMLGFQGLGWVGDKIGPGWSDILQGTAGLGLLGVAGARGLRGPQQRPTWRQSEIDIGKRLQNQNFEPQKSFKNGQEVPYGTKGSTRPEYYKPGTSVEVKNYNLQTPQGRNSLVNNVTKQAQHRAANLPPGTTQEVHLDVRGQNVSRSDLQQLTNDIVSKSNGTLKPGDIKVIR